MAVRARVPPPRRRARRRMRGPGPVCAHHELHGGAGGRARRRMRGPGPAGRGGMGAPAGARSRPATFQTIRRRSPPPTSRPPQPRATRRPSCRPPSARTSEPGIARSSPGARHVDTPRLVASAHAAVYAPYRMPRPFPHIGIGNAAASPIPAGWQQGRPPATCGGRLGRPPPSQHRMKIHRATGRWRKREWKKSAGSHHGGLELAGGRSRAVPLVCACRLP